LVLWKEKQNWPIFARITSYKERRLKNLKSGINEGTLLGPCRKKTAYMGLLWTIAHWRLVILEEMGNILETHKL
jgi:hypothetical protein